MPVHNKLVRDKIPSIIMQSGKSCLTKVLSQDEYVAELKIKLLEEAEEYKNASDKESALEELADVLELLHALAATHEATLEEVEKIRARKAEERGSFAERVYLVETKEHNEKKEL